MSRCLPRQPLEQTSGDSPEDRLKHLDNLIFLDSFSVFNKVMDDL